MGEMYRRHQEIIQAIEAGDLNLCQDLMAIDTEFTQKLNVSRD
jgi:DNA-binding GntR family transcriptional regulator